MYSFSVCWMSFLFDGSDMSFISFGCFGSPWNARSRRTPPLFFPVSDELFGVCNDFRDEIPLGGNNPLNGGFHLVEFVVFALGGTADDQWSPASSMRTESTSSTIA